MKRTLIAAIAGAAVVATLGAGAYAAQQGEGNDALAIAHAKVSLSQAIAAAEQHTGGKAAKAEFEQSKGQWVFDVEVVKGQVVLEVKLDSDGKVISAKEDTPDQAGEKDDRD
jgi:uncharacterized membrane protein YkoI